MSQRNVTDTRHNDFVGGDASRGRIPGAENATSGHFYVAVFPKGVHSSSEREDMCIDNAQRDRRRKTPRRVSTALTKGYRHPQGATVRQEGSTSRLSLRVRS